MPRFLDPPWRRFAIRAKGNGHTYWLTDDGHGGDEACDMTEWSAKELVAQIDQEQAQHHADRMREWARKRGLRLRVIPVWEHTDGTFTLRRKPIEASAA
jgi:hypothetical protein